MLFLSQGLIEMIRKIWISLFRLQAFLMHWNRFALLQYVGMFTNYRILQWQGFFRYVLQILKACGIWETDSSASKNEFSYIFYITCIIEAWKALQLFILVYRWKFCLEIHICKGNVSSALQNVFLTILIELNNVLYLITLPGTHMHIIKIPLLQLSHRRKTLDFAGQMAA